MVSEERVYLDVPFPENDQVKALGARWDGQRRQWWVDPRRVPLEQVARWREEAAPSLAPRASEATVPLRLLGLRQTCWSCRRPTTALVGLLPVATSDIDDMLICQDEATLRLAANLLPEHARTASQVGRIRPRSSNTEQATYLSNGCFHCEALLGNFYLYGRELAAAVRAQGLAVLVEVVRAEVPADAVRPLLATGSTWAGGVLRYEPTAYLFDERLDDGRAGGGWNVDPDAWRPRRSQTRPVGGRRRDLLGWLRRRPAR
jgi:hypothetical protein